MTIEARFKRVLSDLNLLSLAAKESSRDLPLDDKIQMRRLATKLRRVRCELLFEHFVIEDAGKLERQSP